MSHSYSTINPAFQRDFLATRLAALSPAWRKLWRWQFIAVLYPTAAVVAWDHGACIRAVGMARHRFAQRCVQAGQRFLDRLEQLTGQRIRSGSAVPVPLGHPRISADG